MIGGDTQVQGGSFMLGATPSDGFVFDNEKWAHRVEIDSFRIARTCVTNGQFAAFVEDGGYSRAQLWCPEGLAWRCEANAAHPVYWHKNGDSWRVRVFDESRPLIADSPVIHVNWYEADAYCRWAGRRLPSEAEWEYAAATGPERGPKRRYPWGDGEPDSHLANVYGGAGQTVAVDAYAPGDSAWGCRQMVGNVWEWTAGAFHPFPGFVADAYKEYSEPWFGDHKVLRGGCFATRGNLIRNTWRNFYTPDRRDVFAGFRTCA
jgi:iron(II)-dependent oxidoreductase